MILVRNIRLQLNEGQEVLETRLRQRLKWPASQALRYSIYRESIDARKDRPTSFVYQILVDVPKDHPATKHKDITPYDAPDFSHAVFPDGQFQRPVIIGAGPGGLFAALCLSEANLKPIIIEQGEAVPERVVSVDRFWSGGPLNPRSNVQFGEGGAGTFSDGKLTSRSKDPRSHKVLETLVDVGAPTDILVQQLPHIGSDILRHVTMTLRKRIIALGGTFRFNTKLVDFVHDGQTYSLVLDHQGQDDTLQTPWLILAIGHSARDTFRLLDEKGVAMAAKPFAMGLRIEHPQTYIDRTQYGSDAGHPKLGAAPYKLAVPAGNDAQAYTFCMCPGGRVVAAASEPGRLVVNGMSDHARDLSNANSAVLTGVGPKDFGDRLFAGLEFQEMIETKAFELGGGGYTAPIMTPEAFLGLTTPDDLSNIVQPSYAPSTRCADLRDLYPRAITDQLAEGLRQMERRMPGFVHGQEWKPILTAVESRSSSPIRIMRDSESCQSTSHPGLFPCGEGAGYAGGIVSSAIDGLKCGEALIAYLSNQS